MYSGRAMSVTMQRLMLAPVLVLVPVCGGGSGVNIVAVGYDCMNNIM